MDYAHQLPLIPLQGETTITESSSSQPVTIPAVLLEAMSAWQFIENEDERRKVGEQIARKMQELYGKSCVNS